MATQRERTAQEVVEQQSEAIHDLLRLLQHSTVRSNAQLRALVEHAWRSLITANALACAVWFPRDSRGDIEEFLPPAA